jgi:tRNA pseudouridine55 synthase
MTIKKKPGREVHGIVLLDKPKGLSSNRALQNTKRLFAAAKAGHTGSLDPLATGMLPICFGAATRVSSYLLGANKTYTVSAKLGEATDSGDSEGKPVSQSPVPELTPTIIRSSVESFLGESEQVPPMYSALKHNGQRLYALARQGKSVERAPRTVRISEIVVISYERPILKLAVSCSKGTYIRTLMEDIAILLGTVAHVVDLRRNSVEPFDSAGMISMEDLESGYESGGVERLDTLLQPVDSPLGHWPRIAVGRELFDRLSHGQAVPAESAWPKAWVRLYDATDVFFGLGEVGQNGELQPRRIFPGLSSWS